MKHITLIIGLLVVGCGQSDTERLEAEKQHKEIQSRLANKIELEYEKLKVELEAENRKLKVRNNVAAKPVKLTAEEKKVIGEYELKEDRLTFNEVFLENGIVESYVNGKKQSEQKWTIINGQIHTINEDGYIFVWRINKVKSITHIAVIYKDGKQTASPYLQPTYKKIKELTPEEQKAQEQNQKALRDSVVGEYELKEDGDTFKFVLLENGVFQWEEDGEKGDEHKWTIANTEIHVKYPDGDKDVWRINKDTSITNIASIRDGKRIDVPKESQSTLKKIK